MSKKSKYDKDEILSNPDPSVIYVQASYLAHEVAVLGEIDIASRIIDLLLLHHGTEHEFKNAKFLNFAFEQTGRWPSAIPKSAYTKKALDELDPHRSGSMDEAELDALTKQEQLFRQNPVRQLAISINLCQKSGTIDVGEIKQDQRVDRALKKVTENFHFYTHALAEYRNIWPLLASGAIAQRLGVDNAKFSAVAKEILETMRIRFENGRQKGKHEGKPIKELLDMLVVNTKKYARDLDKILGEEPPEGYLHKPTTEKEIEDLEQRLNLPSLPDDYREFLLCSNGLEPVYKELSMTAPLFNTSDVVLGYRPDISDFPLSLVHESTGIDEFIRQAGYDEWPRLTKEIVIGRLDERQYLLIVPSDVKATVEAYKKALASEKVSAAMKVETTRAIEDVYGSMEAFEKLEWAMIYDLNFQPTIAVGTFRTWLEEVVRLSAYSPSYSGDMERCLAYECRL